MSDITRSLKKESLTRSKIENLDPLAVLDHGKTGDVFVNSSENILQLHNEELQEGYSNVEAPMQGMVVKFSVKKGESVWKGRPLLIMEAMKMEHTIKAQVEGKVLQFHFAPGALVEGGASLLDFETSEG